MLTANATDSIDGDQSIGPHVPHTVKNFTQNLNRSPSMKPNLTT